VAGDKPRKRMLLKYCCEPARLRVSLGIRFLGSVPRFLKRFGSQKIGTDRFPKNLGTDDFGSRLFRFGFGSNRTNRNFPAQVKTRINIHVPRQIYATLYPFLLIIIYKAIITIY
jgi:hypothetical protein